MCIQWRIRPSTFPFDAIVSIQIRDVRPERKPRAGKRVRTRGAHRSRPARIIVFIERPLRARLRRTRDGEHTETGAEHSDAGTKHGVAELISSANHRTSSLSRISVITASRGSGENCERNHCHTGVAWHMYSRISGRFVTDDFADCRKSRAALDARIGAEDR